MYFCQEHVSPDNCKFGHLQHFCVKLSETQNNVIANYIHVCHSCLYKYKKSVKCKILLITICSKTIIILSWVAVTKARGSKQMCHYLATK